MLYTRLRESPCNAFALRVSASRASDTRLSCTLALISRGSVHCNFPFGPSTDTCPPSPTFTLTLSGISTALFPIRDMEFVIFLYNGKSLPHVGQQFAANLLLSCFAPRQNASRSGKDRQTHSTKDPRDFIRADVTAQTGATDPPQSRNRARSIHKFIDDLYSRVSGARVDRVIRDVTFLFQDPCDFGFDFRVRNEHLRLLRTRAVADARQKISNRVCNSAHKKIRRLARRASLPGR